MLSVNFMDPILTSDANSRVPAAAVRAVAHPLALRDASTSSPLFGASE
jgi:hypothetical protein